MCLYDWEHLNQTHHVANFNGFRYCGRGDTVLNGMCNFVGGSQIWWPVSLL